MKGVIDTSVLVTGRAPQAVPDEELLVSVVTFAELHQGVLLAVDPRIRSLRLRRLTKLATYFDPVPVDADVAAAYGAVTAIVADRIPQASSRPLGLFVAATALAHGARLHTARPADLQGLDGVLDIVPA